MARRKGKLERDLMVDVHVSVSLPRWVVKEIVAGLEMRASFHMIDGRTSQSLKLRMYANQLREGFLN